MNCACKSIVKMRKIIRSNIIWCFYVSMDTCTPKCWISMILQINDLTSCFLVFVGDLSSMYQIPLFLSRICLWDPGNLNLETFSLFRSRGWIAEALTDFGCKIVHFHKLYDNSTKLYNKKCSVDNCHPTSMQRRSFLQLAFWVKEKRKALPFGQTVCTCTITKVIQLHVAWMNFDEQVWLQFSCDLTTTITSPISKSICPRLLDTSFFACCLPAEPFICQLNVSGSSSRVMVCTIFKDFLRTFQGQMTVFKV